MYSDKPGKHLTLAIDDLNGTSRSISASPNPPSPSTYMMGSADTFGMMTAGGLGGMGSMGSAMSGLAGLGSGGGNGSSGEGDDDQMESHFGRADRKSKKSNRKAAPRTSRACRGSHKSPGVIVWWQTDSNVCYSGSRLSQAKDEMRRRRRPSVQEMRIEWWAMHTVIPYRVLTSPPEMICRGRLYV